MTEHEQRGFEYPPFHPAVETEGERRFRIKARWIVAVIAALTFVSFIAAAAETLTCIPQESDHEHEHETKVCDIYVRPIAYADEPQNYTRIGTTTEGQDWAFRYQQLQQRVFQGHGRQRTVAVLWFERWALR